MALEDWADRSDGYLRVSEYVEVEFPSLPMEDVVPLQVAAVERSIEKLTAEYAKELDLLQARKADLLALTDQRETA
jgi:hypothetical protein